MPLKKVSAKSDKINPLQVMKERKSLSDSLQEELEEKGVNFFSPESSLNIDTDYLSLPKNITDVSGKSLGEFLNAYTQQKMYIRTLLGWAECMCEEAKREYASASSDKYRSLADTKMSEKAKDREVNSDPDILPYYEKYMDLQKKCMLLEYNIADIEDAIFMISREVSRRTGDFNNESRNYNVNK